MKFYGMQTLVEHHFSKCLMPTRGFFCKHEVMHSNYNSYSVVCHFHVIFTSYTTLLNTVTANKRIRPNVAMATAAEAGN